MLFQPETAFLRYIHFGNREVLRGIYVAVRDDSWGTVPPEISRINLEAEGDRFNLTFEIRCHRNEIDFYWKGAIKGDAEGKVVYSMEGVAQSEFKSNRIGFCVLHPIKECAGKPCIVEKADGTIVQGCFPELIAPYQPFMNMRGITYGIAPGLTAEVRFEGDVFEMEDQRNWSDASFKTYCRPLSSPFPFEVTRGQNFSQQVTLTLKGIEAEISAEAIAAPGFSFQVYPDIEFQLPEIGLQINSQGEPLTEVERLRLNKLNIHHLRVDLNLSDPSYPHTLLRANSEAQILGVFLEIALFLGPALEEQFISLINLLKVIKPQVSTWLIFQLGEFTTNEMVITLARNYLSQYDRQAKIGAGSNHYFAELNRSHPPSGLLDCICYPITPQVHSSDETSILETFPILAQMAENAAQFAGGLPIMATPVTLEPRSSPAVYSEQPRLSDHLNSSTIDLRQKSLFWAGWTLGSLKYFSQGHVTSTTYYETAGPFGVMELSQNLPGNELSNFNKVFPVYHAFAMVADRSNGSVIKTHSSDPLTVEGLAFRKDDCLTILIANLTPKEVIVDLKSMRFEASVRYLTQNNVEFACAEPEIFYSQAGELVSPVAGSIHVALGPYAISCIKTTY